MDRLPYPWDNCTDGKNQDSIYDEAYGYHGYSTQVSHNIQYVYMYRLVVPSMVL